jgi:hypothetical protein
VELALVHLVEATAVQDALALAFKVGSRLPVLLLSEALEELLTLEV